MVRSTAPSSHRRVHMPISELRSRCVIPAVFAVATVRKVERPARLVPKAARHMARLQRHTLPQPQREFMK